MNPPSVYVDGLIIYVEIDQEYHILANGRCKFVWCQWSQKMGLERFQWEFTLTRDAVGAI